MSRSIFSVTCTLGRVRAEWAYDFSSQMPPMGRKMMVAFLTDMTTSDARNTGMAMAQFSDAQYVMFWDDDILPKDNEAIAKMVTAMDQHPEIDVLGGVYPCRRQVCDPIVVKDGPYGGVWWGWQDGNIHPVYLTGTGFTLIRLERLPLPESYQIEVPGQGRIAARRYFGETQQWQSDDFYFANLLAEHNLKWCVDGRIVCDQIDLDGKRYSVEQAKAPALMEA